MKTATRILIAVLAFSMLPVLVACAEGETRAAQGGSKGSSTQVVARIGDEEITFDELDRAAKASNMQAYQALFDARSAALNNMVTDRLMESEAKAQGTTKEALLEKEVLSKSTAVTDAEIEAFFNQNRNRMGGRTLEQMKPQLQQYLGSQRNQQAMNSYVSKLKEKYGVKISLDPPRAEVSVAAEDPRKGKEGAAIQIVEFSDFQ